MNQTQRAGWTAPCSRHLQKLQGVMRVAGYPGSVLWRGPWHLICLSGLFSIPSSNFQLFDFSTEKTQMCHIDTRGLDSNPCTSSLVYLLVNDNCVLSVPQCKACGLFLDGSRFFSSAYGERRSKCWATSCLCRFSFSTSLVCTCSLLFFLFVSLCTSQAILEYINLMIPLFSKFSHGHSTQSRSQFVMPPSWLSVSGSDHLLSRSKRSMQGFPWGPLPRPPP